MGILLSCTYIQGKYPAGVFPYRNRNDNGNDDFTLSTSDLARMERKI